MDALDVVILTIIVALGVGRFLLMRDQRRVAARGESEGPRKPSPQRLIARGLLGYAYTAALFILVRFFLSRM
jgi:hypothetical protein